METGSVHHFTVTIYPRLAAVITCSIPVLLVLDGKRGNAYKICEYAYQKKKSDLDD
jgi:hypothetical protein